MAQQHVLRNELVLCDIYQQILLMECLYDMIRQEARDNLHGGCRHIPARDEDSGCELLRDEVLCKSAERLEPYAPIVVEFDPHASNVRFGVGIRCCWERGIFLDHFIRGKGGEVELWAMDVVLGVSVVGSEFLKAHSEFDVGD